MQACSIGLHEVGADSTTSEVYSIVPGGTPCQVTDTSQTYSYSFDQTGPVITQSCRMAAVTVSGVTLSCGGRAFLVPARAGAPIAPSTGSPRPSPPDPARYRLQRPPVPARDRAAMTAVEG